MKVTDLSLDRKERPSTPPVPMLNWAPPIALSCCFPIASLLAYCYSRLAYGKQAQRSKATKPSPSVWLVSGRNEDVFRSTQPPRSTQLPSSFLFTRATNSTAVSSYLVSRNNMQP